MSETMFRIPRTTGTHADVLLVAGLAELLDATSPDGDVRIQERGPTFEVRAHLADDWAERIPADAGYAYLQPKAAAAVAPVVTYVLDYEREKQRVARYHE